jgi:hypothetical protein
VLLDQHDRAGKLAGRDLILEKISEALQPCGRRRRGCGLSPRPDVHSAPGDCEDHEEHGS